ncbi:MAG: hypothetical protein ACOH2E_08330 [Candidatus Paracaedibacter sp.]
MRNKLIAAMLLLSIQINGAELDQGKDTSDNFCQFHMEMEPKEDSSKLDELVNQLEEYYQNESRENPVFKDLNSVFDSGERISFFEGLILEYDNLTNDQAMLEFIRTATGTIISSPEYCSESDNSYDVELMNPPSYVYQHPFLFVLVEELIPIIRYYMRKVGNLCSASQ